MSKLRNNKGITLVALIITIIVLLILAIVSIRLVMNGGIIDRAERGTKAYSDAEIQEQLKLAYQEYQMAKYSETGYTLQNALAKTGLDIVSVEGNDSTGYEVTVNTRDGEKAYVLQPNGSVGVASTEWTYDGHGTYTKGIKQYKVGDKVNYNEGTGYSFTTDTSKGMGESATQNDETGRYDLTSGTYTTEDLSWRILGVNNQGQVELISETPHSVQVTLANEEGYFNGPEELDKMCNALYGKGTGAATENGARSLKVTDINTLANYDPIEDLENYTEYRNAFNTFRKYRFKSDGKYETCSSIDGENWSEWYQIPSYYNITSFTLIGTNTTLSINNPGETEAIRHTYFNCNDIKERITNKISETVANLIVESNLIIDSNNSQWLAENYISTDVRSECCGVFALSSYGNYSAYFLHGSSSPTEGYGLNYYFRPVVTLNSNVQLNWNSTLNQWEIQQ